MKLDCSNNSLSELDLSGCKALTDVKCDGQEVAGLKPEAVEGGYRVSLGNYVSELMRVVFEKIVAFVKGTQTAASAAYDGKGQEIAPVSYDAETGDVTFASRPEAVVYNYRTGHVDSAGAETLMEVALIAANSDDNGEAGSPHSGCDVGGFGALMVLALAAVALRRKA